MHAFHIAVKHTHRREADEWRRNAAAANDKAAVVAAVVQKQRAEIGMLQVCISVLYDTHTNESVFLSVDS
jgi:hypothetical protein